MSKIKLKGAGRPTVKPKRVTVSLSPRCFEALDTLAKEAGVKPSTYCAHVLERYAIQGNDIMGNDILVSRLEKILNQHNTQFSERFGNVLLRIAHEITAERRYTLIEGQAKHGEKENEQLRERSWQLAVRSLRKHVDYIQGENKDEEEPESSKEHS